MVNSFICGAWNRIKKEAWWTELMFLLLPPLPLYRPLLHLGSQWLREGGGNWWNFQGIASWLLGCSSQYPPFPTATSFGSSGIERGNHELISIQHPFIEHLLCACYVLGCGHLEVHNKVLVFKEQQPIKRNGQVTQIQWQGHSGGI